MSTDVKQSGNKVEGSFEAFFDTIKTSPEQTPDDLPRVDPNIPPPSQADSEYISVQEQGFDNLVERCRKLMNDLQSQGQADYDKVKEVIANSKLDYVENPSPSEMSRQLGVIQVTKDRIIEIYADAHKNWIARKRILEILFEAFPAISQAKSADKRKGEAGVKFQEFSLAAVEAEWLFTYCKQMVDNLESQFKTVSRRVVCAQLQLQIGELPTDATDLCLPDKAENAKLFKEVMEEDDRSPKTVDWGQGK